MSPQFVASFKTWLSSRNEFWVTYENSDISAVIEVRISDEEPSGKAKTSKTHQVSDGAGIKALALVPLLAVQPRDCQLHLVIEFQEGS